MQIDEVMALVDEYVSASIEDHGYRSGAASAEYLEDTKRKLLAAIESLIAAPAAPQQAEPVAWRDHVEQRMHNWRQRKMNRSGDRLALDDMMSKESIDDLIDYVCDEWSDPVAPQQAEPVAKIIRNDSGQVRMVDGSGEPFDMFAHVGQSYYAHPTPAEVQRLRDALEKIKLETFDDSAELIARRALEGK